MQQESPAWELSVDRRQSDPNPVLHDLAAFLSPDHAIPEQPPAYWYEGRCPQSGDRLKLPRTALAEAIAQALMQQLAPDNGGEGKMYGILLVETQAGAQKVLKAFSGLLNGQSQMEGWVPPLPGRDRVALEETHTLAQLQAMKQELIGLHQLPARQRYVELAQAWEERWQQLTDRHRQQKLIRHQRRRQHYQTLSGEALAAALAQLDAESRRDGSDRRRLKQQREAVLQPLRQQIAQADTRMRELRQQRRLLSRQLQAQLHRAYCLTNFAGDSLSLQQVMPNGVMPTGTGECCAPKLLHYAAVHGLRPVAMAEFWWGPANRDKLPGHFYGACVDRCQPLMGFLLSGLSRQQERPAADSLSILYADDWVIAIDKPAGLLSVPGRTGDRQDSVLSRLRRDWAVGSPLIAVHRLDQDTSGLLLLARDVPTARLLMQQFQQRQVEKVYEAVLAGPVCLEQGVIDLPLWGNPDDRPRQTVDWQRGKPSSTHFKVMARTADTTRVEFRPITGRTHQLRVHAADPQGLGAPILGDRLYGSGRSADRLCLHARELRLRHPQTGQMLHLQANSPF